MTRFSGLAHRLENCGTFDGILFLNDSKATSIDSVLQALNSVISDSPIRPIHLLIGGKDKNLPWENLAVAAKNSHVRFYFFGQVGELARHKSGIQGPIFDKLGEALQSVKTQLKKDDIVLLSPGGTSWDEFKNFEERGRYFKNWILTEFQGHKR
jgi:UDP-N-acetylmuramoylalanine--D-glutamate ligase